MKTENMIMRIDGFEAPSTQTKFKNEFLQKSTQRISDIYNKAYQYANDKTIQIAKIMADIADKKAYKDDGFDSVADYAEATFGMKKAKAHEYVRAGRIYNDKQAPDELKAMSPSNLSALTGVSMDKIKSDIAAGKINSKTTQKALREYAKAAKTDGAVTPTEKAMKAEVVDTYTITSVPLIVGQDGNPAYMGENRTIQEWIDVLLSYGSSTLGSVSRETIDLPNAKTNPDSKKAALKRKLFIFDSISYVVYFHTYIPKPEPKISKTDIIKGLSDEELAKAIALFKEMRESQESETSQDSQEQQESQDIQEPHESHDGESQF